MSPSKSSRQLAVLLIRLLISKNEYERLEVILSPHTPNFVRPHLPSTADFDERPRSPDREVGIVEAALGARDEFLPATVRQGSRVFVGTYVAATLVDVVLVGIIKKHSHKTIVRNLRNKRSLQTALATSITISLYRTLLRVFSFQKGLKSISPALLAGSLAGLALALHPADARRVTITIYFLTRTLEFCYNFLDDKGYLPREKPWWFGSWLIFPLASAQLIHAFIFDRDCFPRGYGEFILKYSSPYITERPHTIPESRPWPNGHQIVDSLVTISHLDYPKFYSPTLYKASSVPESLRVVEPLITTAHPGISKLTCAILHPNENSCLRVFSQFVGSQWGRVGKVIAAVYALIGLATYRSIQRHPAKAFPALVNRLLRTTTFITMAIGTTWSSICLFQHILPSAFLPQKRFFLSGLLGGLWAFIDRKKGRGRFLYSARLSIESGWKAAVKRGLIKPVKGGDVMLFALSLGILMSLFERAPESVAGGTVRKTMSWIGGQGFVDPVPGADDVRNVSATTTTTTTGSVSGESEDGSSSSQGGSVVLESMGSGSGEDIGEGVRVLDEDFVKSPVSI